MNRIHLTPSDQLAQPAIRLMKKAFPSYSGRKFEIRIAETVDVRSYWDGGSRDTFVFVQLGTGAVSGVVPPQSAFDERLAGAQSVPLADGVGCVEHSTSCGKDRGLCLIIAPENGPRFLPVTIELTDTEALVLIASATLKNSYGGETDIRFSRVHNAYDTSRPSWDAAMIALKDRKLLNATGAITPSGRNAVADHPPLRS
jgi:hypothetical protein